MRRTREGEGGVIVVQGVKVQKLDSIDGCTCSGFADEDKVWREGRRRACARGSE